MRKLILWQIVGTLIVLIASHVTLELTDNPDLMIRAAVLSTLLPISMMVTLAFLSGADHAILASLAITGPCLVVAILSVLVQSELAKVAIGVSVLSCVSAIMLFAEYFGEHPMNKKALFVSLGTQTSITAYYFMKTFPNISNYC